MNRVVVKLLFLVALILLKSNPVFAVDPYATGSAVVSATVPTNITSINPPILVSPANNASLSNSRESLVWQRPDPLPITPIHHYDVYLDGQVFAASVSDAITSQTYYYYTIRRDGNTFYLDMTSDFTQGYHTWSVSVYDTNGINASSGTRTFYIDSVTPFITLKKVDRNTLNWSTSDYSTIPDENHRDITISGPNPLLTGSVEPYANMQFILVCPQNILHCQNQTYLGNYPTGNWQHRFYGLIRGLVYTVYLSATDAAGNSIIFPQFYLAYGIVTPTPSASITPASPTPSGISPTISPEITPEIAVPPITFVPVPPVSPTPPLTDTLVKATPNFFTSYWYLILLLFGLPLHLLLTMLGTKTRFTLLFKFLYTLFFPFLGRKEFQTVPFATIEMYDPNNLDKKWQTKITDIRGFYSLTTHLIDNIFVKISCVDRYWKDVIINSSILSITCLFPIPEDPKMASNRLTTTCMSMRSLPLALACLTSGILLIISPNYFFLIYLYLSLQLVFSEYIYPKISK